MGGDHAALIRTVLLVGALATSWVVAHDVLTADAPEESLAPASARAPADEPASVPSVEPGNVTRPTPDAP